MVPLEHKLVLGVADYSMLAALLLASSSVGLYFQMSSVSRQEQSNEQFLLAGRDMAALPVAFSLMATFMSATNLMGLPADVYLRGTHLAFMNVGFVIGPLVSSLVFLPVYFDQGLTTVYEYLEKRFGKVIRRFVSAMFAVQMVLFSGATLYAPALALSAVTDLSLWTSVLAIGAVCTLYCTLGGMKAVLWTDVLQAALMFTTLIAVIVVGGLTVGPGEIFDNSRLLLPSFEFDLAKHYTFYNIFAQSMILILSSFGGSQISGQRLMAVKTLRRARRVSFLFIPMLVSFQLLCCVCGLVFHAYFRSCDPLTSPDRPIQSADQLMPYFITSSMSGLPGLPGLCIAGIFSASLSTVSSAINSLAAVTYEDFLRPIFPKAEKKSLLCTKLLSVVYGCGCIAVSFAMSSLGSLIELSVLIVGMFAGPNLAVFLLAACTTTANQQGVLVGLIASLGVGCFLSLHPHTEPPLPPSNALCRPNTTSSNATPYIAPPGDAFPLSYMWFSSVGLLTCLVVGYLASAVIASCRGSSPVVPDSLLSPVRRRNPERSIERDCVTRL